MEGSAGSARDARAPRPNRYRAVSLARAHGTAMGFRAEAHWPSLSRDTGITAGDDPEEPGGPLRYRPSILVSLRTQAPQHSWRPDGKWRCFLGIAPFATALSGRSLRPEGALPGPVWLRPRFFPLQTCTVRAECLSSLRRIRPGQLLRNTCSTGPSVTSQRSLRSACQNGRLAGNPAGAGCADWSGRELADARAAFPPSRVQDN